MAGRGQAEGGEIRRMTRACGPWPAPEARSPRPKSPPVARRKATRFVFTRQVKAERDTDYGCALRRAAPLIA